MSAGAGMSCYTLSRLKGIETKFNFACVEAVEPCYILSRLKGIETIVDSVSPARTDALLHTFPFEGNRNFPLSYWVFCSRYITCYTLSRLKGIETCPHYWSDCE